METSDNSILVQYVSTFLCCRARLLGCGSIAGGADLPDHFGHPIAFKGLQSASVTTGLEIVSQFICSGLRLARNNSGTIS